MKMKKYFLTLIVMILTGTMVAVAENPETSRNSQRSQHNPYSGIYRPMPASRSFGLFFAEYNHMTMTYDKPSIYDDPTYHGVSVGFDYFFPVIGRLGISAGGKLQYFFRNEKELNITRKDNLFSGTVPVNLMYDLRWPSGFAINPYAGVYGRYNFSAKAVWEEVDKTGRTTVSLFDKEQSSFYNLEDQVPERLQFGWQAGLNFRISDVVTIGAAYWSDFTDYADNTKLHGFNITLGANF